MLEKKKKKLVTALIFNTSRRNNEHLMTRNASNNILLLVIYKINLNISMSLMVMDTCKTIFRVSFNCKLLFILF